MSVSHLCDLGFTITFTKHIVNITSPNCSLHGTCDGGLHQFALSDLISIPLCIFLSLEVISLVSMCLVIDTADLPTDDDAHYDMVAL